MKRFLATAAILLAFASAMVAQVSFAGPKAGSPLSGKVIETMDSGGYTYVRLEDSGRKIWVAVPQMKVVKGKKMSFTPGMEMKNFQSKTLKRTFDTIYFSEGPAK